MRLGFWGVRGSIPSPGPETVRYGGNTTSLEVCTDSGTLIILDAGTGIYPLSCMLASGTPRDIHIFVTHTHWDHIQGLPFFIPMFVPGNKITLYGPINPVTGKGIGEVLAVQLQYSFFPVREAELNADISYRSLQPGERVCVDDTTTVTAVLMNHPVVDFGYRIVSHGKSLFFTGDHEPAYNIYAPDDDAYDEYDALVKARNNEVLAAMRGVDVLVADAAYTPEEYAAKKGWGHGTFDSCIRMATQAGVARLFCTHHEPARSDTELERVFAEALDRQESHGVEVLLAREGLEIEW